MDDVPRSDLYDDVYFSAADGAAETRHVFLDGNDLPARWQGAAGHVIGETGFGTGLNFLLAWKLFDETAPAGAFLDFVSVEKHPLSADRIRAGLKPWAALLSPYLEKMLAQYPMRVPGFHRMVFDNRVALTLIFDDANDALAQVGGQIDSWFLDGFTPSKNPRMWTTTVFEQMARLSHSQTTFATFTAAGFVKRGLQDAGFHVEKRKGFGTKRDMLAGRFQSGTRQAAAAGKSIAVLGAGLAGVACAHVLKSYGYIPTLYDPSGIAAGASGNALGLVNPRLNALRTAESDFYTGAYALAARLFPIMPDIDYRRTGALHLATNADREKRFMQTQANWQWATEHMQWLDQAEAGERAGIALEHAALYLSDGASLSPRKLCAALAQDAPLIKTAPAGIDALSADAVILACGAAARAYCDLPLQTVRGQITEIAASPASCSVRANLHYGGYLSAAQDGRHYVGATFQRWLDHAETLAEDNARNIAQMQSALPALQGDFHVLSARAGIRCASPDHRPMIGMLREGVYISLAHGSHGIVSSLAAAHLLADRLRGGVRSVSLETEKILSPGRFGAH